jgi:hypothetical protein
MLESRKLTYTGEETTKPRQRADLGIWTVIARCCCLERDQGTIPTYRAKGIVGSLEPLWLAKAPYSAGLSEGIWPPVGGMHMAVAAASRPSPSDAATTTTTGANEGRGCYRALKVLTGHFLPIRLFLTGRYPPGHLLLVLHE